MKKMSVKNKRKINKIGIINNMQTGRGSIALFVKYLNIIDVYQLIWRWAINQNLWIYSMWCWRITYFVELLDNKIRVKER